MKKSKKILISAFAGAFLCAALGGAALCGNQKTVSAAAETLTLTTFKTEDGASVRKDDNYGIRFRASISEAEYQVVQSYATGNNLSAVFGMLVCPQWVLDEKGGELAFDNAAIADYIEDVPVQVWETKNKHMQYACAIVDYPDEKAALTTALTARAYVKDNSGNLVIYADGMATRSLLQTTLVAKANGEEGASLDSIVEKAWQGENPAADYDFSSVIDYDLTKVSVYNGGTVKGIVADSAATNGFALLGNTDIKKDANGAWLETGFSIAMGNIPVDDYSAINVYLRTSDSFNIYANGINLVFEAKHNAYASVNLVALIKAKNAAITELNEISFRRNAVNVSIYVDKIEFIEKQVYNYDFSSADDNDIHAVSSYNGGTVTGIVADEAAADGFALKAVTAHGTNVGVQIVFNDIDISKYSAITLRIRTSHASSPQVSLFANGTSLNCWKGYATYTDVDLISLMKAENIVTLSSLEIVRNSVAGIEIYIDKIELVKKA